MVEFKKQEKERKNKTTKKSAAATTTVEWIFAYAFFDDRMREETLIK